MRDFINYYYNFNISDIHFADGKYLFSYNNSNYIFKNCSDINNLINAIDQLGKQLLKNKYYHQLIYNKDKSLITIIEGQSFVMIKLSLVGNMPISIFDIKCSEKVSLDTKLESLVRIDWISLWKTKIDYFENIIFDSKDDFSIIMSSFYYFVGMAENAILYISDSLHSQNRNHLDKLVVSHKRFYKDMTLIDFYDPTTLIIDHCSRDVAEFLKYLFLENNYSYEVIRDYFNNHVFSSLGIHLLFGRLLFPSFYFDLLEKYIVDGDNHLILLLEERLEDYNSFLNKVFEILNSKYKMREIQWIVKKHG